MLILKKLNPHSQVLEKIKRFFFDKITPLYGDQTKAITKLIEAKDRTCIVLMQDSDPLGLVVYKKHLTDEFEKFGLRKYFEIKTLALIDPEANSGNRYGSLLLLSATKEAVRMNAEGLFVTVSSGKPEAYRFFSKMGFKPAQSVKNLYKQGFDEVYFAHNDPSQLLIYLSTKKGYPIELLRRLKDRNNIHTPLAHVTS